MIDCQIINPGDFDTCPPAQEANYSRKLLEWIAENAFLKSKVFESTIDLGGKEYFCFSISAIDSDNNEYLGFGRSNSRLEAASIASGEVIERLIAKKILKTTEVISTNSVVKIENSEISVTQSKTQTALPSPGFHSSNGWAVHFSLKSALENSVIEALERHILLYTYLHSGWHSFQIDSQVPFKSQTLTPYISKFSFGGFSAGIVATEGKEFPGRTFGYLCDDATEINNSPKWLNAFFESYCQWDAFVKNKPQSIDENWLRKYQHHFLNHTHEAQDGKSFKRSDHPKVESNILMLDIQKVLDLPVPLVGAYTFGRDLIPLFFKQKLSIDESLALGNLLKKWDLPPELPEYHPIL
ncbi:MAG: hypothetical protein A4S09_15150 [Proteobacteria bacterium SG_bin7]|nr:MAG: hypothetical protein A4S09_15150 [Proteobacteria bacterium SG_bin7]